MKPSFKKYFNQIRIFHTA